MEAGIIIIAVAITLIISLAIAEVFGKSKHIGFGWTFALLITTAFIGGIIALIASPSAKDEPTKGGKGYVMGTVVCFVFGALNTIMLNPLALGFIILGAYLYTLSKGEVVNHNPKYYLKNIGKPPYTVKVTAPVNHNGNNINVHQKKVTTYKERKEQLQNLREKGILSETEYKEKINRIQDSKHQAQLFETREYQQLKTLHEDGLLTDTELNNKIELIKKSLYKETEINEEFEEEQSTYYYDKSTEYYRRNPSSKKESVNSNPIGIFLLVTCALLFILFVYLVSLENIS